MQHDCCEKIDTLGLISWGTTVLHLDGERSLLCYRIWRVWSKISSHSHWQIQLSFSRELFFFSRSLWGKKVFKAQSRIREVWKTWLIFCQEIIVVSDFSSGCTSEVPSTLSHTGWPTSKYLSLRVVSWRSKACRKVRLIPIIRRSQYLQLEKSISTR